MKALTVRQPWAWSILHGGKDVENRTQAWKYRGPLAIHAGQSISDRGLESPLYRGAIERLTGGFGDPEFPPGGLAFSAVIGIVELVDIHPASPGCCESPWGERAYTEAGGKVRRQLVHLVLEDPVAFEDPIPAKGSLGLWDFDLDLELYDRTERRA